MVYSVQYVFLRQKAEEVKVQSLGRVAERPETILVFGRPFVKRFALCYRSVVLSVCLSVLSVCL